MKVIIGIGLFFLGIFLVFKSMTPDFQKMQRRDPAVRIDHRIADQQNPAPRREPGMPPPPPPGATK